MPEMTPQDVEMLEAAHDMLRDRQWEWEDSDSSNYCMECGWSTKNDQKNWSDGLSHKPGCRLAAVMKWIEDKAKAAKPEG